MPTGRPDRLIAELAPACYTDAEIRRAISKAGNDRDRLLIEVLWQTGVGVLEASRLTPRDFHPTHHKLLTVRTKRGRREGLVRTIPFTDDLRYKLDVYLSAHDLGPDDRLFPIQRVRIHGIVRDACIEAGLDPARANPRTIQNSFAVHCLRSGVRVLELAQWMGYSHVEYAVRYELSLPARDARRAIAEAFGEEFDPSLLA